MSGIDGPCSGCNVAPCACDKDCCENPCANLCLEDPANPDNPCRTVVTGDITNNIWWYPGAPGYGYSPLDQMTYGQVLDVLQRVPVAKADLLRITNDPCLVALANDSRLVMAEQEENKILQDRLMANSLPFYTVLRGNIDGSI